MRKFISRFATSFAALLTDTNTQVDVSGRIEEIRTAMFDALWALDSHTPETWTAIDRATDVETLWYLRSDLLKDVNAASGEDSATLTLDKITEMFRGMVAPNQMPGRKRQRKSPD